MRLGAWLLLPLSLALARPASAVICSRACSDLMCEGDNCTGPCEDDQKCEASLCRSLCGDGTCLLDQICVNGSCEPPQCETNDHCDGGRCRQCRCEPIPTCSAESGCNCTSNDDCDAGLACSVTGVCQAPVRPGAALDFSCAFAGARDAWGPRAALLLAAIAAGARRRRRISEHMADRDLRRQDP